jgi:hypothetical protein
VCAYRQCVLYVDADAYLFVTTRHLYAGRLAVMLQWLRSDDTTVGGVAHWWFGSCLYVLQLVAGPGLLLP